MEQVEVSTIIENYFNQTVQEYRTANIEKLKKRQIQNIPIAGMNLKTLRMTLSAIKDMKLKFSMETIPDIQFNISTVINKLIMERQQEYNTLVNSINEKYKKELEEKQAEADNIYQEARKDIKPLEDKHKELLAYKETLNKVLTRYNINSSGVAIDDNLTMEEFNALIDSSIQICKRYAKEDKDLLGKLFKEDPREEDMIFAILVFVVCVLFLSPFLLIAYSALSIIRTKNMYDNIDKLHIAESMMYEFDYEKFIPETEKVTVDTQEIENRKLEELKSLDDKKPDLLYNQFMNEWAKYQDKIENITYELREEILKEQDKINEYYNEQIDKIEKAIDYILSNTVPFGSSIHDEPLMDRNFKVCEEDTNIYISEEYGLNNIIIDPAIPYVERANYIKILTWNFLLNVKEKCISVYLFDPENIGRDFGDYMSTDYAGFFDLLQDEDFEKTIKELNNYMRDNIRLLGDGTIDDFNREAAAVGKITRDYKLVICFSGINKNNADILNNLLPYSAQYGVQFIIVSNEVKTDNCRVVKKLPNNVIKYTPELGARCRATYRKVFDDSRPKPILYRSEFEPKVCPEEKVWTYNTIKGIELNFGFANGDPSEYYSLMLGDANVHCLMVGASGSGKSATINQMLASLLLKYSPTELELVMIDFKNVEFSKLTKDGISRIPQAKIIAGTTDGEYALSIFQYLVEEMNRRQEICAQYGEVNLEDYRRKHPDAPIIPRMLVLIDEFQVMFTQVDTKILDQIKNAITALSKLARAFGCHLWFTSQSMKGTLDKDIMDQFSLRVALRCSSQTSTDIIGHDAASKWIKTKVGCLVTNDSAGEDPTKSILWKIPLIETAEVNAIVDYIGTLEDPNSKKALFYNEKTKSESSALFEVVNKYEALQDTKNVILGDRATFSTNAAPVNFNFSKSTGENLFVLASEVSDQLNIARTIIDNAQAKDIKFMINCADDGNHKMLEVDRLIDEHLLPATTSDYSLEDFIELMYSLIDMRKSKGVTDDMYVILMNWDEKFGYGRNENFGAINDMDSLFMDAPKSGIHFIMICRSMGEIKTKALNLFNHKVAALCSDVDSNKVLNAVSASKLPPAIENKGNFAIYRRQSILTKFKIYQHTFSRTLEATEVVL